MDGSVMGGTAYDSLAEAHGGEERWAFGTGFDAPLAGVDTTIGDAVDAALLARVCLALGDDALVLAQRVAGWCSRAPELEDEVALANIGLDLLGQARLLLTRAGAADPSLRPAAAPAQLSDEDALAYFRAPEAFTNVWLMELDDGVDFAVAMLRLLVATVWRLELLASLSGTDPGLAAVSGDPVLAAVARRSVGELTYHRDYAAGWVVRLGDGTPESRERMASAVSTVLPLLAELAEAAPAAVEGTLAVLREVFSAATLDVGLGAALSQSVLGRGRGGQHTAALSVLLDELQSVARADLDASW